MMKDARMHGEGKQTEERQPKVSDYIKKELELKYVNKVLSEIVENIEKYSDKDALKEDYKKLVSFVVKYLEKDKYLRGMDPKKKPIVIREINRIFFEKFPHCVAFREHINRVLTYRLSDLKREIKDNNWKMKIMFLTELLRKNPSNRDLLEKLKGIVIFLFFLIFRGFLMT